MVDQMGDPIVGVKSKLRSEVRAGDDSLIADFTITETETAGSYLFSISDTSAWPIGILYTDIKYTDNGITSSSETISIVVEKDITI